MSYFKKQPSQLTQRQETKRKKFTFAEDQEVEVKEAFQLFDTHKSGSITYHELKIIMRALGFDVKKSEVVQMAHEFDIEETGKLQYEDYVEVMKKKYSEKDPIEETLKAFKLFDTEGRGRISLNDLRKVSKELGETLKEEELIAMIEEFDHDGDGEINEEEFLAMLRPSLL